MLKTRIKTKLGAKAKQVAKHPELRRLAPQAIKITSRSIAKPIAKRRARQRARRIGATARDIATAIETYAPLVARASASLSPPKRKRLAPKLGAAFLGTGAALGAAAAVYFQAERGHRRQPDA